MAEETDSPPGEDLTQDGQLSLSKALLTVLGRRGQPTSTALELYVRYCREHSLVSAEDNLSALKRFPNFENLFVEQKFALHEPQADPDRLSFWSFSDVNRLSRLAGVHLTIHFGDPDDCLETFHDFCDEHVDPRLVPVHLLLCVRSSVLALREVDPGFVRRRLRASPVLTDPRLGFAKLRHGRDCLALTLTTYLSGHLKVLRRNSWDRRASLPAHPCRGCWSTTRDLALARTTTGNDVDYDGAPRCVDSHGQLWDVLTSDPCQMTTSDIDECTTAVVVLQFNRVCRVTASPRFSFLGPNVSTTRGPFRPNNTHFSTLCVLRPPDVGAYVAASSSRSIFVVFFSSDGRLGRLRECHAKILRSSYARLVNPESTQRTDFCGAVAGAKEQEAVPVKEKKVNTRKRLRRERDSEVRNARRCSCELCRPPGGYDQNMSQVGPEKPVRTKLLVSDLLRMCGLASPTHLSLLDEACSLGVAAFDIESRTVDVDLDAPDPYGALKFREVDLHGPGLHTRRVQKPCMLAVTDSLSGMSVLECGDDNEHTIYDMFRRFWLDLLARQERLRVRRREILTPLYDWVEKYRRAHEMFCREWAEIYGHLAVRLDNDEETGTRSCRRREQKNDKDVSHARSDVLLGFGLSEENLKKWAAVSAFDTFRNSVFGQLERGMDRLCRRLEVFSFYGSRYDNVLTLGYLAAYLYETDERPRIQRKGNAVSVIGTRSGVTFRDVCKLLSPGCSLREFGRLFGLEQEKAHFPFSYLDSVKRLREPRLPRDLSFWISELASGADVPRHEEDCVGDPQAAQRRNLFRRRAAEDLHEAETLFDLRGCVDLGEYLRVYLELDVEILFRATQLWRRNLRELVGVDFVESGTFTVSSLANFALGKSMAERNCVAMFSCNNSQNYRLLRQGMRGGLTQIFRSEAGSQSLRPREIRDDPSYRNNSHLALLRGEDPSRTQEPSEHVVYLDITSLYPSSGESFF